MRAKYLSFLPESYDSYISASLYAESYKQFLHYLLKMTAKG